MHEKLSIHPIFTDHMVLQRNAEVPIWGSGPEGSRVVIECAGNRRETFVSGGKWRASLPTANAGGPHTLSVRTDRATLTMTDVLFGDVWLAGGQSNMQWTLRDSAGAEAEIARAGDYPEIRYFDVPRVAFDDGTEHTASWEICDSATAGDFSAVAYYFAQNIQRRLNVPVGIVGCNFGATSASCWVSESRLSEDDDLRVYLDEFRQIVKDFDWAAYEREEKRFQDEAAAYNRRLADGLTGTELGVHPWPPPMSPRSFMRPNGLYETMIKKAASYGLKGFIYYQGESDADKAMIYDKLLASLIDNWRTDWGNPELPFLFAQLTAFGCDGNPDGDSWALLRESQLIVSEQVPNTAMAVILDCGEEHDIHPRNKRPVGERLALAALDRVYGLDVRSSGPVWTDMRLEGEKAVLRFAYAGEQLRAGDSNEPTGFEIAGRDGRYVPARASIAGDTVTVWSDEIAEPVAVRYGWRNYTEANLTNEDGLPAGPFRTCRQGR